MRLNRRISLLVVVVLLSSTALVGAAMTVAPAAAAAPVPAQFVDVRAGQGFTCGLTTAGGVQCWGSSAAGALGSPGPDVSNPRDVTGLASGVAGIGVGRWHACALTTTGGVRCWGYGGNGQLGVGNLKSGSTPVTPVGLTSGVATLTVGKYQNCATLTSGTVKCWGYNGYGQLGLEPTVGINTNVTVPTVATGITFGVASLVTGSYFTCAVTTAGGVKCWGKDDGGQLGDGLTTSHWQPADVTGLTSGVRSIAAGESYTCAVLDAGGVKCWGPNDSGQLGDGTTTTRTSPVSVVGLPGPVTQIAAGGFGNPEGVDAFSHTSAVLDTGGLVCWGANSYGQLGDDTTTMHTSPVAVTGLPSGVMAVHVGATHTCAVLSDHSARCWGRNAFGEVGDGTTTDRLTPVTVVLASTSCPDLGTPPANVTLVGLSNGTAIGSVATYAPAPGYGLVGPAAITCLAPGSWSSPPPTATLLPPPTVLPGVGSVVEGNSGTTVLQVPVTLSNASAQTVMVLWSTAYGPGAPGYMAVPGADYQASSGTVTFNPGETAKTVTVLVNGDTLVEPDEYLVVSFHDPTNANVGGYWGLGFGIITNDDHATVIPGAGTVVAPLSGSADLVVPVTLSNPSTVAVTAQWTTLFVSGSPPDPWLGPQAPTGDYVASSGTVTFPPGQTTAEIHIPVLADSSPGPDEHLVIAFHDPTNATMGGFWGLGFGIITPTP